MSIFNSLASVEILQKQIQANAGVHAYKTKLAEAAGCQRSYLSQVLAEIAHLMPEHAMGLAAFWEFNSLETDYFLTLSLHARAGSTTLKNFYFEKLANIKREALNLDKKFSRNEMSDSEAVQIYYSIWYYSAIHILTTIPEYQTKDRICERLQLPREVVDRCLQDLLKMNLVFEEAGTWSATSENLHLSKDSVLSMTYLNSWHERSLKNAFLKRETDLHYLSIHSCSREDYERIRATILDCVQKSRDIVTPSKEEELICIAFDLFKV